MKPIQPGQILLREIQASGSSGGEPVLALRVLSGRVTSILHRKRAVSADTALRLVCRFGVTAQFGMNLQSRPPDRRGWTNGRAYGGMCVR